MECCGGGGGGGIGEVRRDPRIDARARADVLTLTGVVGVEGIIAGGVDGNAIDGGAGGVVTGVEDVGKEEYSQG